MCAPHTWPPHLLCPDLVIFRQGTDSGLSLHHPSYTFHSSAGGVHTAPAGGREVVPDLSQTGRRTEKAGSEIRLQHLPQTDFTDARTPGLPSCLKPAPPTHFQPCLNFPPQRTVPNEKLGFCVACLGLVPPGAINGLNAGPSQAREHLRPAYMGIFTPSGNVPGPKLVKSHSGPEECPFPCSPRAQFLNGIST